MKIFTFLFLFLVIIVSGCKKETVSPDNHLSIESQTINDFVKIIVYPNYQDILNQSALMQQHLNSLKDTISDANLSLARNAWRNSRNAWERCLCFSFGPVDDDGFDSSIDSWPVDVVDLQSILQSNQTLNEAYIQSLPASLRGYHAIEYLLFGQSGTKTSNMLTARETLYLTLIGQDLNSTVSSLVTAWTPTQSGSFGNEVLLTGNGSNRFSSRKELFSTIAGSLESTCDELANQDMEIPLSQKDSSYCQSVYSDNTLSDFKNTMTGILAVYTGQAQQSGYGLSQIVVAKDPAMDKSIRTDIQNAITALNNITPTYEKAIYNQPSQIKAAQTAITTLEDYLNKNLNAFIENNIND